MNFESHPVTCRIGIGSDEVDLISVKGMQLCLAANVFFITMKKAIKSTLRDHFGCFRKNLLNEVLGEIQLHRNTRLFRLTSFVTWVSFFFYFFRDLMGAIDKFYHVYVIVTIPIFFPSYLQHYSIIFALINFVLFKKN